MTFYRDFSAVFTSVAMSSALVMTIPHPVRAMTGTQVNEIARDVTVLIVSQQGQGSGVIIAREGDRYFVLTNQHVVSEQAEYGIVTSDRQTHKIDSNNVRFLPDVDLAVVQFTSDAEYTVARLGAVGVAEGQDVFVSGWPAPDATGQLVRQFTSGGVSALLAQPIMGYQIAYTNVTRPGMSGGPVFDAGGRVVGIHGWGGYEDPAQIASVFGMNEDAAANIMRLFKSGFNYAIPINIYLQQAPQAGVYLNVQVDTAPAQELEQPYVASNEPDERDVIEDINGVMDIIGKAGSIICGIFGC